MVITWVIVAVAIGFFWFFFKFKNLKHKAYAIFIILLLVFLFITGTKVVNDNKVEISTLKGVLNAGKLYFTWLFQLGSNIKTITGDAINMNWGNVTAG